MIPGFPTVGGMELLIILGVILLFFGAKRIPELARSLGRGTREFRQEINEGATEVDPQQDGKKEDQEKPLSDGAAHHEVPQAEAETTRVGQKAQHWMFGVGPQEVLVIVLLLLVVFGPGKAVGIARDLGRFANTAREQVDDFKDELLHGEDEDDGSKP